VVQPCSFVAGGVATKPWLARDRSGDNHTGYGAGAPSIVAARPGKIAMNKPFEGRTALVTGAGSGMGRAHAELLAARGAHVVAQDLDGEAAGRVAGAIVARGLAAEAMVGDAADAPAIGAAIAALAARRGAVDILVNNAGVSGMQTPFLDVSEAAYDRMMAVHVKSAFFAAQAAVPGMKARRRGRIINVSSMFAMKGSPNAPHYTAAKGALLGLTKALALELAPWNITVNALAPGLVKTAMTMASLKDHAEFDRRAARTPLGRLAEPVDLAYAVAFLASDEAAMITGQTISPNGGDAIVGI
jgi:3-oxoacyl-[acyl-carrier protein] reductase